MIPKQDRQSVRRAVDIEQKYDLNKDFSEIERVANEAKSTATAANTKANYAKELADENAESIETLSESHAALSETVGENTEAISENTEDISDLTERVTDLEENPGEPGATFTPHVDSAGNLSWTNDKELENPETVNIKGTQGDAGYTPVKGVDYFDGQDGTDGTPCTHSWNGTTLTVTSASGTSSADLKGDKGDPGTGGTPGTNATINGVSTLNIVAGDNVVISQSGNTLTISASGGNEGTKIIKVSYAGTGTYSESNPNSAYVGFVPKLWFVHYYNPTNNYSRFFIYNHPDLTSTYQGCRRLTVNSNSTASGYQINGMYARYENGTVWWYSASAENQINFNGSTYEIIFIG